MVVLFYLEDSQNHLQVFCSYIHRTLQYIRNSYIISMHLIYQPFRSGWQVKARNDEIFAFASWLESRPRATALTDPLCSVLEGHGTIVLDCFTLEPLYRLQ